MSWDNVWNEIFENREWGRYPAEDLIRFIAKNYYKEIGRRKIKILEIGCGTGANLWYMAREGFSVYGIDGSKVAINKAKQRLDSEIKNWSGELLEGDVVNLPFKDNYFDAVVDSEVICCNSYEDSKRIYDEIWRVLKPGGKMFSRTFAKTCYGDETGEQVGHNAFLPNVGPLKGIGYCRFTKYEEITDLLGKKFTIEEIESLERTSGNLKNVIKEWLIIAIK